MAHVQHDAVVGEVLGSSEEEEDERELLREGSARVEASKMKHCDKLDEKIGEVVVE